MLTATELEAQRTIEESVLLTTAYVVRNSGTADGMGGLRDVWGTVGTALVDLWPINRRGDREQVRGNQLTSEADWFITFAWDFDVTHADRVEIDGMTFEVTFVPESSQWQTAKRVEARQFNQERRV